MAYGTKYRIQFSNQISENYYIFLNRKDYNGDITFITGSSGVLKIKSFNSDDDRFSPILSKECTIGIFINKNETTDITNFISEHDDDWNIVVKRELGQPPIFEGFLIVEDSSQPLHDRPFEITLRASDGLSLLKDVPLTNVIGEKFEGLHSITNYLGAALYKANPGISYKFYSDIFHLEMDRAKCPYDQMQLDARTFEKDETSAESCYSVIEKICTDLQCRVFYENGFWHIVSLWQYHKDYGFNYWIFVMIAGEMVQSSYNERDIRVAKIGKEELIYAINKDAVIYYKLASKLVKKTFNYEIPSEIVKNQTFKIGAELAGYQGSYVDTSVTPNQTIKYNGYALNGWMQQRGIVSAGAPLTYPAYIRRETDVYNYERSRFLVLPSQSNNPGTIFVLSSLFSIGQSDKINISIESRRKNGYSGPENALIFAVLLRGDNGINYTLDDNAANGLGPWIQSNSGFTINGKAIQHNTASSENTSEWVTTSVDSAACPVNGTIQIVLYEQSATRFQNETWYRNLKIEYLPYIMGGYAPVKGDFNVFSQNNNINKTVEETISISDSPKKIIKGAIFVNNLLASPEWYRIDFPNERARFTQIMAITKYNFVFRQFKKIEGSLKGLSLFNTSQENIPFGFLPQYYLSDITDQPNTKFILTSFEIDYHTATWRGVLVAVQVNSTEPYDTYDFKYFFQ